MYDIEYSIDTSTIPLYWIPSIESAALTWTNVIPSIFSLTREDSSPNFIDLGIIDQSQIRIASTLIYASPTTITKVTTTFDETDNFDITQTLGTYHIENIMAHEFGHWYMLSDIDVSGCEDATMWHQGAYAETKKITLEGADIEGANWQYP